MPDHAEPATQVPHDKYERLIKAAQAAVHHQGGRRASL